MLSKLHDNLENLLVLDNQTGIFFKPWDTTNISFYMAAPVSVQDEVKPVF